MNICQLSNLILVLRFGLFHVGLLKASGDLFEFFVENIQVFVNESISSLHDGKPLYDVVSRHLRGTIPDLEFGGKMVNAMAYVMTPGHELGAPHDDYYQTILEGYRDNSIDPRPLDEAVCWSRERGF